MKQTNIFDFVKIAKKLKNSTTEGICITGVLDLNNEDISLLTNLAESNCIDDIVIDLSENLSKSIYYDILKSGTSIKINMYYGGICGGFYFNDIEEMLEAFSLYKRKELKKVLKDYSVYIRDMDYFLKTDKFNK